MNQQPTQPTITWATTDAERAAIQALFSKTFPGIEDNAVPVVAYDAMYTPRIAQIRDDAGELIAAAMSCRAQVAAATAMLPPQLAAQMGNYGPVMDKHSELDLIAVAEPYRSRGLGSQLVTHLENTLAGQGVKAWFGNVTANLEVDRLREFYTAHGFTIVPDGEPLPDLLGRSWVPQHAERPAFFFYKRPRASASQG